MRVYGWLRRDISKNFIRRSWIAGIHRFCKKDATPAAKVAPMSEATKSKLARARREFRAAFEILVGSDQRTPQREFPTA